ncbi:MAG: hypothetical protein M0R74_11030 [Dehalococcoidia bacterium]|nr:hypothetical protein [Dehalococcoidia bacterium]
MLLVSAQLVAAGIACLVTARGRRAGPPHHAAGWVACGLVALGLGAALLFSLDLELIHILRSVGWRLGFYGERRPLQELVIQSVVVFAALGTGVFLFWSRTWPGALRIALCASIGLMVLATVWGVSFHGTDQLLRRDVAGQASGAVLTQVGAVVLAGAALWERRMRDRGQ